MKFPYGIANFHKVITESYFYVDRTACIQHIEDAGAQLLFLRPRRFGKSLALSMLENYYDVAKADEFDRLFGHLAIGRKPTPLHNQYFVLRWDFSNVNPQGSPDAVERALHTYLNTCCDDFAAYYEGRLARPIEIHPTDAVATFRSLLTAVRLTPHRLYLLIDEYDNFANEMLMAMPGVGTERYAGLLRGEGALRTVFKAVKSAASGGGLDRVFITGVSPIVLSDMTSGYNVAKSISHLSEFDELCGFTEAEISAAIQQVMTECNQSGGEAEAVLDDMRRHYNGYRFSARQSDLIYNPTLALYYLDHYLSECCPPDNLLDSNLAMDRGKLSYIAALPGGAKMIVEALNNDVALDGPKLADRFGVEDMLAAHKDTTFMASLLYYFGVLTLAPKPGALGKLQLRIPNLVIRKLYVERLQALLLPNSQEPTEGRRAAETLYETGDLQPLCDFIEQRYFKVFSNRDYLQANELTIKTAFLTLLFNDGLYVMDSETPVGRRYADLTLIVRPDARQYQVYDLLLEFKFVKPGDLNLSGEALRTMSQEELTALPQVQAKLKEARAQAPAYQRDVEERYQSTALRLRTFAVVALGFDRLVWEEIGNVG
ncbi:MAG TPA: AAA family ATPase [Blastocatellia bacterium]|nr:AAA family ATPase [Blastocatellia bacterium]HMV84485.1 AAA family ATPase [Blastocatellia bacterium]HMX24920.1 AAA family ATPase [Blastocatellia bacterium]HMY70895.1 AAA family ATPase [Blastocatellia bacterium]HMZ18124.1 AAA family ATPase [Blastocatellia bacterium]